MVYSVYYVMRLLTFLCIYAGLIKTLSSAASPLVDGSSESAVEQVIFASPSRREMKTPGIFEEHKIIRHQKAI